MKKYSLILIFKCLTGIFISIASGGEQISVNNKEAVVDLKLIDDLFLEMTLESLSELKAISLNKKIDQEMREEAANYLVYDLNSIDAISQYYDGKKQSFANKLAFVEGLTEEKIKMLINVKREGFVLAAMGSI